jgi:hypothetical protein
LARCWPSSTGVWAEGRRYLGIDVMTRSRAAVDPTKEDTDEPTIQAINA